MSDFKSLNLTDLAKSLVMVVLSAVLVPVYSAVQAFLSGGAFTLDLTEVLKIGLSAGLAYLAKNFMTDSEGKLFGKI